jgi:HEXXH motif-containing protein
MATPQDDQYDSEVSLRLAETSLEPLREALYQRRPPDGAPAIFDGAIAIRCIETSRLAPPRFQAAPADHPNLSRAAGYVRRWPAVHEQMKRLVDTIHPFVDLLIPPHLRDFVLGSSSHSEEARFGSMCVTVDHALCLAQAVVHEMAHHKLRSLGVSMNRAARLITNDPLRLFESPIRKDRKRPMTAVFHAQYSFIHVTCLDLHMIEGEADPVTREDMLMLLARNVPRMEAGMDEIEPNIETDAEGRVFVGAFLDWAREVIGRGNAVLDKNGYGMPALPE